MHRWWTAGLLIGLLTGCALPPERPPPIAEEPIAEAVEIPLPLADDVDTPGFGNAPGPRIRRAARPGLQELLLTDADEPADEVLIGDEILTDTGVDTDVEAAVAAGDLWERIRNGFGLAERDHPRVRATTNWYSRHPAYFERVTEQAEPYLHYIVGEVEQRGMPSELALLPVVESAFQPYAYSSGRAAGLWQFIPDTGRRFGLKLNWWYDGRRDVVASTQAALGYLQYLHDTFDGDWLLALAAYNAGEGTVARAIRENRRKGKPTDFWSLRLPRETQEYVPRLLAISAIVAAPAERGIELKTIPDEYYLTAVEVDSQLDLAIAAELAEMSVDELLRLNPAFNRWATDPEGPHRLLLPADRAAGFSIGLAALPPERRVRWLSHRVHKGETLGAIAARYHTTVPVLRRLNDLEHGTLRADQDLWVPVAQQGTEAAGTAALRHTHTVATGDTLWDLARRYRVSVKDLAAWNGLDTRRPLRVGQSLVVQPGAVIDNAAVSPIDTRRKIVYTVRKGDSLTSISKRYQVSIGQLKKWNGLKEKTPRLRAGQRLTVHIDMLADAH